MPLSKTTDEQREPVRTKEEILNNLRYDRIDTVHISRKMLLRLLKEYAESYAQVRFEKAMVEEKEIQGNEGDEFRSYLHGYNQSRSEITKRWNESR